MKKKPCLEIKKKKQKNYLGSKLLLIKDKTMAQSVKYLLCKHEVLILESQHFNYKEGYGYMCCTAVL